jgi:hypothetical protein
VHFCVQGVAGEESVELGVVFTAQDGCFARVAVDFALKGVGDGFGMVRSMILDGREQYVPFTIRSLPMEYVLWAASALMKDSECVPFNPPDDEQDSLVSLTVLWLLASRFVHERVHGLRPFAVRRQALSHRNFPRELGTGRDHEGLGWKGVLESPPLSSAAKGDLTISPWDPDMWYRDK